jgi:hypothetical protein
LEGSDYSHSELPKTDVCPGPSLPKASLKGPTFVHIFEIQIQLSHPPRDIYEYFLLNFVSMICVYIVDSTDVTARSRNSRRTGQSGREQVLLGGGGKWPLKE